MVRDDVLNEYFDWMCQLVSDKQYIGDHSYSKLLSKLHNIPFTYTIDMDGNRAADGIDLRYRFGYERNYEDYIIASFLDDKPCSVLGKFLHPFYKHTLIAFHILLHVLYCHLL